MMNVGLRSNPTVTVAKTADTRLLVFWRPGKFSGVFVNGFSKSRTFHGYGKWQSYSQQHMIG